MESICSAQRAESQQYCLRGKKLRIHSLIHQSSSVLNVTPVVIKLSTAQVYQKSVFCVASRDMKLETVDQVNRDQEDKVRMVTLCNGVK